MSDTRQQSPLETPGSVLILNCVFLLAGGGLLYFVLFFIWGEHMPITWNELWGDGFVAAGLGKVWFIFAWAITLALLGAAIHGRCYSSYSRAHLLGKSVWLSVCVGWAEELTYRGTVFLAATVMVTFVNWLWNAILGWLIYDPVRWVYEHVLVAFADWTTFYALHEQLTDPRSWVIGAAIISANVSFRDAHKHYGWLGLINVWFMGMVMFWLTFNYGLLTAVAAHVIYDVIVFSVLALRSTNDRWAALKSLR